MPQKKSHRVASRQAAASKERKKKKKAQATQHKAKPSPPQPQAADVAPAKPVATPVSQPAREVDHSFHFISRDLRKVAIIAGPMIIVLIVLGFIL